VDTHLAEVADDVTVTATRHDVSGVAPYDGSAEVAVWVYAPDRTAVGEDTQLIVCLPGGTYSGRGYYDPAVPGPGDDYSLARFLARLGHVVAVVDHLGVGESSAPRDPTVLTPEVVAGANQAATDQIEAGLASGGLVPGLPALPGLQSIGIGHSMGGMLTIFQQAAHGTHSRVAILGWSALHLEADDEVMASVPIPGAEYHELDRSFARLVFHFDDVPDDVVDADNTAAVAIPGPLLAAASTPGITTELAAGIDVPVLIGCGERDVVPDPHQEPAAYRSSKDVTLMVLERSGHCHNFASTRHRLWRRLAQWIAD
jgi:pimeloyl-ACP methyl ester carboxylesterase